MAIQSAEEFVSIMWQCAEHDAPRAEWLRHITARDDAIRAEGTALLDRYGKHDYGCEMYQSFKAETGRCYCGLSEARAQPVPAPKHGEGGAERAGDEVMQSREAMLRKLDAERAKETGDGE